MTPRSIGNDLVRAAPSLDRDDTVAHAVERIVESGPAGPTGHRRSRRAVRHLRGARVHGSAPGYVRELGYAGFVPRKLDEAFEKRAACATEPVADHMNTEHIDVTEDFSDVEVAETFLHHRVLILPVTRNRRVVGAITRSDFFQQLAKRLLGTP